MVIFKVPSYKQLLFNVLVFNVWFLKGEVEILGREGNHPLNPLVVSSVGRRGTCKNGGMDSNNGRLPVCLLL